jgi:hypothetical protein
MKNTLGKMTVAIVAVLLIVIFIAAGHAIARETARDGRFIASDNGTVQDSRTGLMWASQDNGSDIHWTDAKNYCANYRGGGYTDWRMPTEDELAGLFDNSKTYKSDGGYKVHLTKLIHLTTTWIWTSAGFRFNFFDGKRVVVKTAYGFVYYRVLPVRSGK